MSFISSAPSSPDPFTIVEEQSAAAANHDANGKTLYTGSLSGAVILIIAGQSNAANSFPTPYTPSNTTVYNLNVYDGAVYKAVDPLLGCSTVAPAGHFGGRLADKIIAAGPATKVVLVPVSISGTVVSQWTGPTNFGNRISVAIARLAARGLTPSVILWGQGESDLATTQAVYSLT
jgi:hypothetical protein